jgi:hypothetical protein
MLKINIADLIETGLLPLILLIVFFTYLPIKNNHFITDDYAILAFAAQNNLHPSSFIEPINRHFQPALRALIAIEYHFFRTNPEGYYWINILLHVSNTYLVILLFSILLSNRLIGCFTGLLFGCSASIWDPPMWITCQGNLLAGFCLLVSTIFFVKYLEQKNIWLLFISSVFHIIMLFSYTSGFEIPVVFFLLWCLFAYLSGFQGKIFSRQIIKSLTPFLCNMFLYIIITNMLRQETHVSINNALACSKYFLTNTPKVLSYMMGGIYAGFIRSFSGVYSVCFEDKPYRIAFLLKPTIWQLIYLSCFLVSILFLIDWQCIPRKSKQLVSIVVFILVMFCFYTLPALGRWGYSINYFANSSRYLYLPCFFAAASMAVIWSLSRAFCHIHKNYLSLLLHWLLFIVVIIANISELRRLENIREVRSHNFKKIEDVFIAEIQALLAQKGEFYIADEPICEINIDNPIAPDLSASTIARLYFPKTAIARIRFLDSQNKIGENIKLYNVKEGHLNKKIKTGESNE